MNYVEETQSIKGYPRIKDLLIPDIMSFKTHATFKTKKDKAHLRSLRDNAKITHLFIKNVTSSELKEISDSTNITHLRIEGCKAEDLSEISPLENLQYLYIETCSTIESGKCFSQLTNLKGLQLVNFSKINSLEPFAALTKLKFFAFEGTLNKNLKVKSLEPINELTNIEALHLTAVNFEDKSLRPISNLKSLTDFKIGCFFPAEEFARLSGSLPNCKSMWFQPTRSSPIKCKKGHKKVMLSGSKLRDLCPECDNEKLNKFINDFEKYRMEAYEWQEKGCNNSYNRTQ